MSNDSYLALDTETTTSNHGNPFDQTNRLVCYSLATADDAWARLDDEATRREVQSAIDAVDMLLMFNAKFDLHWLTRCGIKWADKKIWDCQLAEFMLSNQTWPFPDMRAAALRYGLPAKLDVVKTEYWDKGIDTPDIPWKVLDEYATHDAWLTREIYFKQLVEFEKRPALYRLFLLHCRDLAILAEMEQAGLLMDEEICEQERIKLEAEQDELLKTLEGVYPDLAINFGSGDQLSAFLYGGTIKEEQRQIVGYYKSGKRMGEPRYSVSIVQHELPRLFEPIKGSELKKEGVYGTSEDLLNKLKGGGKRRVILNTLLRLATVRKLLSTYYVGLPKLRKEMHWPKGHLYGQYNQCRAITGRLSSSKPNQQNMSGDILEMFVSRFSHEESKHDNALAEPS